MAACLIKSAIIPTSVRACASVGACVTAGTYIHECGHKLALNMLFSNVQPKITLRNYGFDGGETDWGDTEPLKTSYLGTKLGLDASKAIVHAAGIVAEKTTVAALSLLLPTYVTLPIKMVTDFRALYYVASGLFDWSLYTGNIKDRNKQNEAHDILNFRADVGVLPTIAFGAVCLGTAILSQYAFWSTYINNINQCRA